MPIQSRPAVPPLDRPSTERLRSRREDNICRHAWHETIPPCIPGLQRWYSTTRRREAAKQPITYTTTI